MMHIPMQKYLSEYVEQVKKQEYSYDDWINEPVYQMTNDKWISRADLWEESEIEAGRRAWEAAKKHP